MELYKDWALHPNPEDVPELGELSRVTAIEADRTRTEFRRGPQWDAWLGDRTPEDLVLTGIRAAAEMQRFVYVPPIPPVQQWQTGVSWMDARGVETMRIVDRLIAIEPPLSPEEAVHFREGAKWGVHAWEESAMGHKVRRDLARLPIL